MQPSTKIMKFVAIGSGVYALDPANMVIYETVSGNLRIFSYLPLYKYLRKTKCMVLMSMKPCR